MVKYQLHIKSQHQKCRGKNKGPDHYVAVTIAPDDAILPLALNRTVLEKRGIQIKYFGDGYGAYRGLKSQLGQAIASAKKFIAENE